MDKQDKRNLTRGAVAIVLVACLAFLLFWYVGGSPGDRVAIPERAATPGTVAPPTRSDAAAPDRPAAAPDRDAASTSAEPPTTAQPSAATPQTSADSTATALRDSPAANEPNLIEGQVASPAEDRPAAASGATATLPAVGPATGGDAASSRATPTPPAAGRATSGSAAIVQRPSPPAAADGQQALLPPMRPPTFDVVRVNEYGDAVIAGRAEPRAIVIIYDGEEEIGRVAADGRGDWVFVSDRPLSPGQHELGLVAQIGGQQRMSDQVVVLIAPEPRRDIAGRDSEADEEREKPLALLIPRDEIGATRVLQAPAAGPAPGAPDTPTPPSGTDAESPPVSIDVVDYDEEGQLIVSGRSAPDSAVRLYLDNQLVGEAQADASGVFQVQPTEPVAPGVHAMRVDEVDTGGAVTARAETPFERPLEIVEAPPGYSRVIVQPGNSLWRLARRVYGHGIQYTVIYQANFGQIRDPDLIYPGQVFNLPEVPRSVPGGDPS